MSEEQKNNATQPPKPVVAAAATTQSVAPNGPQPAAAAAAIPRTRTSLPCSRIILNTNPAARASNASEPKTTKKPAKIFRNPRIFPPGSNGAHRPIGPRGSVILLEDNKSLDRTKAVKGVRDQSKTVIKFRDTNGNIHEHRFSGHTAKKWDNEAWITKLNKWRYQTIDRKFKRDPHCQKKGSRGRWSVAEKQFLKEQLKKRAEETGNRMFREDWRIIANNHKQRFAGKTVKKGEQLLSGVASRDYTIGERTALGIRAAFSKMKDLKDMVDEIVAEFTDDESSDGELMEGVVKGTENKQDSMNIDDEKDEEDEDEKVTCKHRGDLDHHLEDPSDDEDDGQRPASNPTGAILVSAC